MTAREIRAKRPYNRVKPSPVEAWFAANTEAAEYVRDWANHFSRRLLARHLHRRWGWPFASNGEVLWVWLGRTAR